MSADQVLVGRNNPRRAYNMRVRQKQNIEDPLPVAGDKLVCLRNNRKKGLFNGGLWRGERGGPAETRIITHRVSPPEGFWPKGEKGAGGGGRFGRGLQDTPPGARQNPLP